MVAPTRQVRDGVITLLEAADPGPDIAAKRLPIDDLDAVPPAGRLYVWVSGVTAEKKDRSGMTAEVTVEVGYAKRTLTEAQEDASEDIIWTVIDALELEPVATDDHGNPRNHKWELRAPYDTDILRTAGVYATGVGFSYKVLTR